MSDHTQAGLECCPEHDTPLHNGSCDRCGWKPTEDQKDKGLRHVKELKAKLKQVAKNDPLVPPRRSEP